MTGPGSQVENGANIALDILHNAARENQPLGSSEMGVFTEKRSNMRSATSLRT